MIHKNTVTIPSHYKTFDIVLKKDFIYGASIFDDNEDNFITYKVGDIVRVYQEYKHYDVNNPNNNILDDEWVVIPDNYLYINKDYFVTLDEHRENQIGLLLE